MSLIIIEPFNGTETKFVSSGFIMNDRIIITDYIQYYNGKNVARFKVKEKF